MSRDRRIIALMVVAVLGLGSGRVLMDAQLGMNFASGRGAHDGIQIGTESHDRLGSLDRAGSTRQGALVPDVKASSDAATSTKIDQGPLRTHVSPPISNPDRIVTGATPGRSTQAAIGANSLGDGSDGGARQNDVAMAHREIDTIPLRGMRVDTATPCAFHFFPERFPDKTIRFSVGSQEPVVVSVHGPGSGSCRIDGQPMEDGRQYPLKDGTTLQADTGVGVHLRPLKDARLRLPDANG